MGRHEAPVPLGRRIVGAVLGVSTMVVLFGALWAISRNPPDEALSAAPTTFAPISTSTTSSPPTTIVSTVSSTTPRTTAANDVTSPPSTPLTIPGEPTSQTTISTTRTTSTTLPPIDLRPDGLGLVDLGDPYDEARPVVESALGPPDSDTGWINADSDFGVCPGTVLRVVRWSSLRLFFSDGPTEFAEEVSHFFYYSQSGAETDQPLDLETPQGIGLESTVEELREAYGADLTIQSTIDFGITFAVDPPGLGLLAGTLTSTGAEGIVTSMGGGFGCGA